MVKDDVWKEMNHHAWLALKIRMTKLGMSVETGRRAVAEQLGNLCCCEIQLLSSRDSS